MLAELFAFGLVRANVCAALAIVAVLAVRRPVRRRLGAQAAYLLWAAVPAAMAASSFPSLHPLSGAALDGPGAAGIGALRLPGGVAEAALALWLAGVVAAAARFRLADLRFRRAARAGRAGPAVSGVLWPRLVTPSDFRSRFSPAEQALIGAHEREHIRRGDPLANLLLAALQAFAWFNPLMPLAAAHLRLDQEMACDEAVLSRRPAARAAYARALLKAQVVAQGRGYGWAAFGGAHPVESRLRVLADSRAGRRPLVGAVAAALPVAMVVAVWALSPAAFRAENPMGGPRSAALLIDLTPGSSAR